MSSPRHTATRQAQLIFSDANVIATSVASALNNLDIGKAGFKSGLEGGSNPDSITGTTVERLALQTPDKARQDEAALLRALNDAERACKHAAALAVRWATWSVDGKTVQERLTAADAGIWCTNCGPKGHKNPKAPEHNECEFCAGFRNDYKQPAPKDVLDLRATKGRIYEQDITRILARLKVDAKNNKTARTKPKKRIAA